MTDKEALKLALDWYDSGAEHRDEFQVMIESIVVQRKPLTHKEIWNAIRPLTQSDAVCMSLVQISMDEYRAIEAAHGIKENT